MRDAISRTVDRIIMGSFVGGVLFCTAVMGVLGFAVAGIISLALS